MRRVYFLLFFILCTGYACAQSHILTKDDRQVIENFKVLPDRNYSFEKIISDSSLPFTPNPLLYNFKENSAYWIKYSIQNPFRNAQEYYVSVFPFIDNDFYFYDKDQYKWQKMSSGLVKSDNTRTYGYFPLTIDNNSISVFYSRVNVKALENFKDSTHIRLRLYKAAVINADEQKSRIVWISTLVIIFILFLYNLYTWLVFKDRAFLYYLLILTGSAFYLTALKRHLNLLTSFRWFHVQLTKEGYTFYYDQASVVTDLAILLILTGFLQFTRNYLQTKATLPKYDRLLKYSNVIFSLVVFFVIISGTLSDGYTPVYTHMVMNSFTIVLIFLIIWVGIVSYKRKYLFGKYFLLANALPLLLVMLVAIYFIINPVGADKSTPLPNLAILSLVITFAVALFARINVLKQDLGNEQLQAQSLVNNLKMAEQSNTEKEIVLKEIHHRVKNNLQIINGLLFMQFKDNNDEKMKAQLKQSQERIKSMALVHNKLYESDSTVHVYIKEYIKDLAGDILKTNTPAGKSIQLNIQENEAINLSLDTSVSLGLILNELITNACKYAFTGKESGHINITINKQGSGYQLIVKDNGDGLADDFHQKNSMGLRLVSNLAKQLGGQAKFENNNGTVVIVDFVDRVAA